VNPLVKFAVYLALAGVVSFLFALIPGRQIEVPEPAPVPEVKSKLESPTGGGPKLLPEPAATAGAASPLRGDVRVAA
jgi:hypothetical protein